MTSMSLCACPVRTINGVVIAARLTRAYVRLFGRDFVAQYLRHLN